jgi:hypothetical protein
MAIEQKRCSKVWPVAAVGVHVGCLCLVARFLLSVIIITGR